MQYRKPARLSDPMNDFSPEELTGILSKKDSELDWRDFDRLFQGKLPAGTYEELCYYFPLACAYIENQADACDFFEHFSVWIGDHYERLKTDGLIAPAVSAFHTLFRKATSSFSLEENGGHCLYPSGCGPVESLLEALFRLSPTCPEFSADILFSELKEDMSFAHAEWIVYISTEMEALSPERIRSVLSASEYQAALDVLDENIDAIMGGEKLYAFWGKRI